MWSCMQGDPGDNIVGPFYCWETNYLSLSCAQTKHIMWCMWHIKSFSLAGININRMSHWADQAAVWINSDYLWFFFLGKSQITHCACMQFLFWIWFLVGEAHLTFQTGNLSSGGVPVESAFWELGNSNLNGTHHWTRVATFIKWIVAFLVVGFRKDKFSAGSSVVFILALYLAP